jgi:hydrogenase maturation protease
VSAAGRSRGVLVVALGDPCRADDGVGRAVAREVAALRLPGVTVVEHREPVDLLDLWCDAARVVVVDAVRPGAAPGTVHTVDVTAAGGGTRAPAPRGPAGGTHAVGLPEVVALARALGRLPEGLVVVGVEGASSARGGPLSPAVAAAVPQAVQAVLDVIGAAVTPRGA